jgi:expansin (peptidoglycan-binding protein)
MFYLVVQPLGMGDLSPAPACGWTIHVTNTGSDDGVGGKGKAVTVTVVDTCPACNAHHLDLSFGAWDALTDSAPAGTIDIKWYWIGPR